MSAVLAVCAGALVAACGSEEKPPSEKSPREVLKERLIATEKRLPRDEVLPTFQALADAMAAARDAGMGQDAMLGEVLASHVRHWKRPAGIKETLANNQALGDQARAGHVVTVPAPASQNDKPRGGVGRYRAAGRGPAAQLTPTKPQDVVGIFGNGVLNTSQEATQAATALGGALGQKIEEAYNVSAKDAATSFANGQAMGRAVREKQEIPEVKQYVDMMVKREGVPAKGSAGAMGVDVFAQKLPSLFLQYEGQAWKAQENTAYAALMAQGRAALGAGKPVILISHSEGGFPVREAKRDLDKEVAKFRQDHGQPDAPSPVGALYIAPPFGDETTSSLNTEDSKYVLLRGDFINLINDIRLRPTAEPTGNQPSAWSTNMGDTVTLHLLNTYLQDGTDSRQQVIKAFNELKDHVCGQPAVTGLKSRPGRRVSCPARPPAPEAPERPGQPPGEPQEREPERPPGQPPEDTQEPTTPKQPTTHEPPAPTGTPGEPTHVPEPPQVPPQPPAPPAPPTHTPAPGARR
ncbi:hypothetical protein FCH28_35250 [Streptomyces piniterrae]|uniref:Uncharacterized protein n=1 Tax=Streptomyces piniterrae TaxID=2571125 RepID=A0A4U0MNB9_9ACTN|nr:hypothetical protein [Streptomyces piniterrae]TJZ42271.1 hypothetical protein FCH28_35250 [Streptomyces piniterrae]